MTISFLNPEEALIFRITHRDNLPWILDHGLHARTSEIQDPHFRQIGDFELISKRPLRHVKVGARGTLSDYIPFYFTPFSMMAFNIHTGHRGIEQIPNQDLIFLTSSIPKLSELGIPFVFTNGHAYSVATRYFTDTSDLAAIDWKNLQSRDFKRDLDDLGRTDRYQAEALIWEHLPIDALLGICGCNTSVQREIEKQLTTRRLAVKAYEKGNWFF
ncbi:MAG: DUF4433 domain-containing protein [Terracidiphilus sp.]